MGAGGPLGITGNLVLEILSKETTYDLFNTFLILIIGFLLAKLSTRIILMVYRTSKLKKGDYISLNEENEPLFKIIRYVIMSFTIIIALIYLRVAVLENLLFTYELLPTLVSIVLASVLGIIVIEFIVYLLKLLLVAVGLVEYLELYSRTHILGAILWIARVLLYLVFFEIFLRMVGIEFAPFTTFLTIVFYASIFLFVVLSFFGFRDFVDNFYAGLYLRGMPMFRIGRYINYKNYSGEIANISRVATIINVGKKVLWVPNKLLASTELVFEKVKPELKTLDAIKKYFAEQKPSYCGPASAQIVLSIFGFDINQDKIGELCDTKVGVGTHPDTMIKVVEGLTKKKIRGMWIDYDHITDLKQEISNWLNQNALIIIDYKKNYLFPDAQRAHYSVILGIEGEELLVVDPSFKTGGVYYVEIGRVFNGMNTYSELIKGKRGYIVFAKKGTNAYWRIENKVYYSDMTLYKDLSKGVNDRLEKITKKAEVIKSIFPKNIKKYLEDWEKREKVYRVWKPKKS